jgi:hypothetical protein
MAPAETHNSTSPEHYIWRFPGSPIEVRLDLRVVQQLKEHLQRIGPEDTPDTGLLFGDDARGVTEVLGFEPLRTRSVPEAIAVARSDSKRKIVGFYREELSDWLQLGEADQDLAAASFPNAHDVFLVIRRSTNAPRMATFFFHNADGTMADFAFLEFPLDERLLALDETDRAQRSNKPAVKIAPVKPNVTDVTNTPIPARVRAPSTDGSPRRPAVSRTVGLALAGVGVIALVTALLAMTSFGRKLISPKEAPTASESVLGLKAERQSADLRLSWNRDDPAILQALSGVLSIEENGASRSITLNPAQMRSGFVVYAPTSGQVQIQLTAFGAKTSTSESVMVILPHGSLPQQVGVSDGPKTDAFKTDGSKTSLINYHASEAASPSITKTSDPTPYTPSSYTPPIVTAHYVPVLPSPLSSMIQGSKLIAVRVSVDKNGNVVAASVLPRVEPLPDAVIASAVNAVKQWRFRPAYAGSQPIAGETVVSFQFK